MSRIDQVDNFEDLILTVVLFDEFKDLCTNTRYVCNFKDGWTLIKVFLEKRDHEHF